MHGTFKGILIATWLAATGLGAGAANAASIVRFTANYTGNYFDAFYTNSGNNPYTTANRIIGYFVAEFPENPPNNYFGAEVVRSYSFSDGVQTLTNLNSVGSFSIFYFGGLNFGLTSFDLVQGSYVGNIRFSISDNGSYEGGATQSGEGFTYNVGYNWTATRSEVPEPASWTMLIAGFGLTGAATRRRRAVAANA